MLDITDCIKWYLFDSTLQLIDWSRTDNVGKENAASKWEGSERAEGAAHRRRWALCDVNLWCRQGQSDHSAHDYATTVQEHR